jgi:DNA-binding Xre family transcriptional regulator
MPFGSLSERIIKMLARIVENQMQENHFSLRDAAIQIGISHTTLDRFLKEGNVDLDTLVKICNWLGVRVSTALDAYQNGEEALVPKLNLLLESDHSLAYALNDGVKYIEGAYIPPDVMMDILLYIGFRMRVALKRAWEKKHISTAG